MDRGRRCVACIIIRRDSRIWSRGVRRRVHCDREAARWPSCRLISSAHEERRTKLGVQSWSVDAGLFRTTAVVVVDAADRAGCWHSGCPLRLPQPAIMLKFQFEHHRSNETTGRRRRTLARLKSVAEPLVRSGPSTDLAQALRLKDGWGGGSRGKEDWDPGSWYSSEIDLRGPGSAVSRYRRSGTRRAGGCLARSGRRWREWRGRFSICYW